MTKSELVEYARKHYPVGTTFKSPEDGKTYIVKKFTNPSAEKFDETYYVVFSCGEDVILSGNNKTSGGQYLYYKGQWGEIISQQTYTPQECKDQKLVVICHSPEQANKLAQVWKPNWIDNWNVGKGYENFEVFFNKNCPEWETETGYFTRKQGGLKTIDFSQVNFNEMSKTQLPAKWCISRNLTLEQNKIVTDWINKKFYTGYSDYRTPCYYIITDTTHGYVDTLTEIRAEGYTEITFEQFENYILNKTTMQTTDKKIAGYKLTKTEYLDAVKTITTNVWWNEHADSNLTVDGWHFSESNSKDSLAGKFRKAGVLDLWFEPVYEAEFKIGDVIYVTKILDNDVWLNKTDERVFRLIKEPTMYQSMNAWTVENLQGKRQGGLIADFRKATPQEIEAATKIEIGGYEVEFKQNSVKINGHLYGLTDLKDFKRLLENHKEQVKSINVGCSGQYKVDLETITKIVNKFN